MEDQAGIQAMSPEDVRRQTQGKPTMQQQALKGKQQQPSQPESYRLFGRNSGRGSRHKSSDGRDE